MSVTFNALATFSDCYKKAQKMPKGIPEGIIVHSTGANNPNLKRYVNAPSVCGINPNKNYFGGPGSNDVTPHGVIGKDKNGIVKAAQILPYNICCWGCGRGSKGSYNYSPAYIQFEIAEDGLKDSNYFNSAFDLAAKWCAELMEQYPSIKLENIVSHKEAAIRGYASNHGDPENWLSKFEKDMNWFRTKVKEYSIKKTTPTNKGITYLTLDKITSSRSPVLTGLFREYGPQYWSSHWHNGVDIAGSANDNIYAAADGEVIRIGSIASQNGFGNSVLIKHADDKASLYAHMIATPLVKIGDKVKKGQLIGKMGGTGNKQNSYDIHLHFSLFEQWSKYPNMFYGGKPVDPITTIGKGNLKFNRKSVTLLQTNGTTKTINPNVVYAASSSVKPSVEASAFKPYLVKVNTNILNFRSGAGTNYTKKGSIRKGEVYTIVEESDGLGASKWGKLKSGAGWISLDYVIKQ